MVGRLEREPKHLTNSLHRTRAGCVYFHIGHAGLPPVGKFCWFLARSPSTNFHSTSSAPTLPCWALSQGPSWTGHLPARRGRCRQNPCTNDHSCGTLSALSYAGSRLDGADGPQYQWGRNQPQPGGTPYLGDGWPIVQFTVNQETDHCCRRPAARPSFCSAEL